jgi:hypothetical protein
LQRLHRNTKGRERVNLLEGENRLDKGLSSGDVEVSPMQRSKESHDLILKILKVRSLEPSHSKRKAKVLQREWCRSDRKPIENLSEVDVIASNWGDNALFEVCQETGDHAKVAQDYCVLVLSLADIN